MNDDPLRWRARASSPRSFRRRVCVYKTGEGRSLWRTAGRGLRQRTRVNIQQEVVLKRLETILSCVIRMLTFLDDKAQEGVCGLRMKMRIIPAIARLGVLMWFEQTSAQETPR
jgi:hypothetical protein